MPYDPREHATTNPYAPSLEPYEVQRDDLVRPESTTWAALTHVAALAFFVLPFCGHIIGPLVVWLIKRDDDALVDDQGKESLNFQLSVTIYALLISPLVLVLIGIPLLVLLALYWIICIVVATMSAAAGNAYRYPLTIRFFR